MFGAVKLAKHVDVDQYKYFGYGIGFDRKGSCSVGNEVGRNLIIFGKLHSINLTKQNTKFYLRLHYNRANSYLFVNDTEIIKFKAKDSEIAAYPLCLESISKD